MKKSFITSGPVLFPFITQFDKEDRNSKCTYI